MFLGYHERHEDERTADAWLLMTRLPGASPWDVLVHSAPAERPDYFRRAGNLLRQVHSTPAPAALRNQPPWVDRALELARNNLTWCDGSADLLGQLEATRPAPGPEVVIHGDLALDNVLIDRDGNSSLIDWSGGDLGDPRYDLSLALATDPEIPAPRFAAATASSVSAFMWCDPEPSGFPDSDILTSSALEVAQSWMAGPMSIQEFSRITGMSSHTLRYYERAGLMPRVERNPSGHRRYSERHERWWDSYVTCGWPGCRSRPSVAIVALLDQGRTGDAQRMALLREHRDDLAGRLEHLKHHLVPINQKLRDGCGPDVERARLRRGNRGAKRRSP